MYLLGQVSRVNVENRTPRNAGRFRWRKPNGPGDSPIVRRIDRSSPILKQSTMIIDEPPRSDPRSQPTSTPASSSCSSCLCPIFLLSTRDSVDERTGSSSSPPRFACMRFLLLLLLPPSSSARRHRLHDYALAFLGPGIVLLVGRVYQRVALLVLFHVLPHPAENKKKRWISMYVCMQTYVRRDLA